MRDEHDAKRAAFETQYEADGLALDIEGLDLLRLGGDGLIADFTVMVRPLSAAQTLAAAMAKRLGAPAAGRDGA